MFNVNNIYLCTVLLNQKINIVEELLKIENILHYTLMLLSLLTPFGILVRMYENNNKQRHNMQHKTVHVAFTWTNMFKLRTALYYSINEYTLFFASEIVII